MTQQQPDTAEFYEASEQFEPEDVDLSTHNPNRCNLPVQSCPACSALERD
jgi:hypothetical protein